jgi:hypothetical protein
MSEKRKIQGNIYKIIHPTENRYFQYVYSDLNYLGGDLICVFNLETETTDLDEILHSGFKFYLYTTILAGIKIKKWSLVGKKTVADKIKDDFSFRWREGETFEWYRLEYKKKEKIGVSLTHENFNIPVVCFEFPFHAVQSMLLSKEVFLKKNIDFENDVYLADKSS